MTTRGRFRALIGPLVAACLLAVLPAGAAAGPVAPGCTAPRSSFVGGTLVGYPDGRALDAHIGVSVGYHDAAGRLHVVQPDGQPIQPIVASTGGYSWIEALNNRVPATGTTDPAADRTWGMCVWGGVTVFYAEVYPKDPQDPDPTVAQVTDKSRYGSTAYYAGAVREGQRLNVALRAPVTYQAAGGSTAGNTGGVQGYITYAGKYVPATAITRVRAFPGPGAACGVEGYSAAADQLTTAAAPDRTFYRMDYLAGGQCGQAYQGYSFQVSAVIDGVTRSFSRGIHVVKGVWPRLDVALR